MTRRILTILLLTTFSFHCFAQVKENQSKNEAIVYDVTTDPEAVSANLLQILQKMPLVQVNASEEITLTGLSGITIYVNGVPQLLPQIGISSFIKSMPANQVERLEIYTSHHAADQALDEGGIINIITRKQKDEGMSVNVSGHTATSTLSGGNVMLNAKHKNFFFDGGYAYTYQNYETLDIDATDFSNKSNDTFTHSHSNIRHDNNHNAHINTGLNLTEKDIIGLSYNMYLNPGNSETEAQSILLSTKKPCLYSYAKADAQLTNHNLNAYYRHYFNNGGYFSVAYKQGSSKTKIEADIATAAIVPTSTGITEPVKEQAVLRRSSATTNLKEHAIRLDAFVPLNHANAIGAGTRYSSKSYDYLQTNLNRWTVYLQYSLQLSKFRLNAGLHWELPYDIFYHIDDSNILYPFLNLSYQITPNGWFSADYTMQRTAPEPTLPKGWIGHKYLNKLNLSYRYTGTKFQTSADLIYHNSPNSMVLTKEITPYYNYKELYLAHIHYKQVLFSLAGSYKISPSIRLQATAMVAQQTYTIVNEKELDGTYGQLSGGAIFTFPGLFNLTANGGYYFPRQIKGNKEMGNYFYRLNLSKELLKKHLIVALYATDFIGDKRFTQTFNNLTERNVMQTKEFGLSLTYQFFKK